MDYITENGLDVNQSEFRGSLNIPVSTKTNGIDYAYLVNQKAKQRLALMKKSLTKIDSLQAMNRYKWGDFPTGLNANLMERMFYYRYTGMMYYDTTLEKWFFLPYALTSVDNETIDFYGRYINVKPYPFNGKASTNKNAVNKSVAEVYLGTITRKAVYDMKQLDDYIEANGIDWCKENLCIVGRDYTEPLSQWSEPLSNSQSVWIDQQAEILPMLRTTILKNCMPMLVKCSDEGVKDSVLYELQAIEDSVIAGKTMIPVASMQDMDVVEGKGSANNIADMLSVWEGYDNIRKSMLGIRNDGAFQKKTQILQDEQDQNNVKTDLILDDGLKNRQELCDMANKLWGLNMSVETNESSEGGSDDGEEDNNYDADLHNEDI